MSTEIVMQRASGMELLAELSRKVNDPQAAIEIAKQIVELETRWESLTQSRDRFEWEKLDREAKVAFSLAFKKFKESAPKILKTKHVSFPNKSGGETDYWHVELDKACDLLIPALLKQDITHRWKSTDLPGGFTRVTCYLRHRLGYEEEGASLAGPADQSGGKNPIQGVGSSTAYLERYTFLATCGIVPSGRDDDGNGNSGISNDEGAQWVAEIESSITPEMTMAIWQKSIDLAKSQKTIDYRAMTIFTAARDKRLKELKKSK